MFLCQTGKESIELNSFSQFEINLNILEKRKSQLKNCLPSDWPIGKCVGCFLGDINVGVPSSLWMVQSLESLSWAVQENRLISQEKQVSLSIPAFMFLS